MALFQSRVVFFFLYVSIGGCFAGTAPKNRCESTVAAESGPMLLQTKTQIRKQPCMCEASNGAWTRPNRTNNKCVFIDLGAAGGDTFQKFMNNGFGHAKKCNNQDDWEAFLIEANPHFKDQLLQVAKSHPGKVHTFGGQAAYMCKGVTSFFLDPNVKHNHWGSSMDGAAHTASDWQKPNQMRDGAKHQMSNRVKVTVPTVNVVQLIYENSIPGDYVIVKMDIEGAEWDVVPCLSKSQSVGTLSALYVEQHPVNWQLGDTTPDEFKSATHRLIQQGVFVPHYYSPTL